MISLLAPLSRGRFKSQRRFRSSEAHVQEQPSVPSAAKITRNPDWERKATLKNHKKLTKARKLPSPSEIQSLKDLSASHPRWSHIPHLRRQWFDELGKFWAFSSLEDWYSVRSDDVFNAPGGATLINNRFGGSHPKALMDAYPEHTWVYWKFMRLPRSLSKDPGLQRAFFEWAGKLLGIDDDHLDKWYSVPAQKLEDIGGHFIGTVFKSNLSAALAVSYPNHEWLPWLFRSVPRHFWHSIVNQRKFADWYMKEKLQSSTLDVWYEVSTAGIRQNGGHGWLKRYKHSFVVALKHTYPEHTWFVWKFTHVPHNYWSDVANRRRYFEWLGEQLGFKSYEDFYQLKIADFDKHHGRGLLYSRYGDRIVKAIQDSIPEHRWDIEKFRSIL